MGARSCKCSHLHQSLLHAAGPEGPAEGQWRILSIAPTGLVSLTVIPQPGSNVLYKDMNTDTIPLRGVYTMQLLTFSHCVPPPPCLRFATMIIYDQFGSGCGAQCPSRLSAQALQV